MNLFLLSKTTFYISISSEFTPQQGLAHITRQRWFQAKGKPCSSHAWTYVSANFLCIAPGMGNGNKKFKTKVRLALRKFIMRYITILKGHFKWDQLREFDEAFHQQISRLSAVVGNFLRNRSTAAKLTHPMLVRIMMRMKSFINRRLSPRMSKPY